MIFGSRLSLLIRGEAMQCKWYENCPIVKFNENGMVSDGYISRFCRSDPKQCRHFCNNQNTEIFDMFGSAEDPKIEPAEKTKASSQ